MGVAQVTWQQAIVAFSDVISSNLHWVSVDEVTGLVEGVVTKENTYSNQLVNNLNTENPSIQGYSWKCVYVCAYEGGKTSECKTT